MISCAIPLWKPPRPRERRWIDFIWNIADTHRDCPATDGWRRRSWSSRNAKLSAIGATQTLNVIIPSAEEGMITCTKNIVPPTPFFCQAVRLSWIASLALCLNGSKKRPKLLSNPFHIRLPSMIFIRGLWYWKRLLKLAADFQHA